MKLYKLLITLVTLCCAMVVRAQGESATTLSDAVPVTVATPANDSQDDANGVIEGRVSNMADQKFLTNARVSIDGTIHEDLTDEYGSYRFSNLRAGTYTIRAFFTGLEPKTVTVTIKTPGQHVTKDIELASQALMDAMRGSNDGQGPRTKDDEVVFLEKFSVVSSREMAGNVIATNEQRFANNIKSVIETDAFGDMNAGNAAEFLKYMPGVVVDYDGIEANSVSVRGFGSAYTPVTSDGAMIASAASGNDTRSFQFDQMSITDVSRIEVAKAQLPSMSANALGGSVNMISKNAFDSKRASFKYQAMYSFNSENLEFMRATPGPMYSDTFKSLPGANFTLTLPVTRNFGVVVSGMYVNQYNEQHQSRTTWNFQENALDRLDLQKDPYLQSYQIQSRPKQIERDSFSIRADWKLKRNHIFSFSYRINYAESLSGKRNMNWDMTEKSQIDDSGVYAPREWGWAPDWGYYVISPENYIDSKGNFKGERFIKQNVGGTKEKGVTNAAIFKYRYTGNQWELDSMINYSVSKAWQRDGDEGYFSNATTQMIDRSGRIGIFGINGSEAPASIKAFAVRTQEEIDHGFAFGDEMDVYDLQNYSINSVQLSKYDAEDSIKNIQLNLKRVLGGLPFFASVKVGGDYRLQDRDIVRDKNSLTFLDPKKLEYTDLISRGYRNASLYIDDPYSTVNSGFGMPTFDWISPQKLYQTYVKNPTWFSATDSQARDNARETFRGSKQISEAVTAFYTQFDGRFFQNRLTVTTGARWEMTDDRGRGCLEQTEGATAADVYANWIMRGAYAHRTYNDFYPSFFASYNVTENFIARVAYARTLGRPDFSEIIPSVKIKDKLSETGDGDPYTSQIEATNPDLEPYTADNFDITFEYYLRNGGEIRLAGYYKRIDGLFVEVHSRATREDLVRLNIGSDFLRVPLIQKINLDSLTTNYGMELECRTPLTFLGQWGKAFDFSFNLTLSQIEGDYRVDFKGFTKQSANVMLSYSIKRLRLGLNCNYRGSQRKGAQTGDEYQRSREGSVDDVPFSGFYEYSVPTWRLEANMEYRFSKNLTFFATAKNINNPTVELERYNPVSAAYAPYSKSYNSEKYGAQFTFGVKGSF